MRLYAWAQTDTGRRRDHNEDGYLVDEAIGLFGVADGMGGHQGGEHASRLALQVLYRRIADAHGDFDAAARALGPADASLGAPCRVLRAAARAASSAIFTAAAANPQLYGMGTTLTAMLYDAGTMHVIHAGDSRCYLLRGGAIRQVTDDHSWIAEQLRAGTLTESQARASRFRHVITRSVGFERELEVDTRAVAVEAGDCFLLCTDGLSNYIDNLELERVMTKTWFRRAPQLLVDLANQRGGDDNITVVAVMIANEALDDPT